VNSEPVNAWIDGRAVQVGDPIVRYKLLQSIILLLFPVPVSNSSLSPIVELQWSKMMRTSVSVEWTIIKVSGETESLAS
jgi:hypothetical protein